MAPRRGSVGRNTGVLVVGAGPTGLALALQAHDHGALVRIVERRQDALRPSRALLVYPRTLEVLRPLGVTDALLARADIAPEVDLHFGRGPTRVRLADFALDDTAFPHLSLLAQTDVEMVLAAALAERGVEVERGTELLEAGDGAGGAWATLRSSTGVERTRCSFIAGCDGAASTLRAGAGISWRGGTYAHEIVLADGELDGDLAPGVLGPDVAAHRLASTPGTGLVAVRPDGYIGFRCGVADMPQLRAWLARIGLA